MQNKLFFIFQVYGFLLLLSSCGSSGGGASPGSTPAAALASGQHIVGATAVQYTQKNIMVNLSPGQAEDTGYTLDLKGIVINGSLSGTPAGSEDYYRFNTSSFNSVNVQVFINGQGQTEASHNGFISLFSAVPNGYSHLMGSDYFIRAWIQPSQEWIIGISTSGSYQIEIIGGQ